MANPLNPSFETAGVNAGEAQNWTDAQSNGGEDIAIFDTTASGDRPMEDYETQYQEPETALATYNEDSISEFATMDLSAALFDGAAEEEAFEGNWLEPATAGALWNQHSIIVFEAGDLDTAMFDFAADPYEDFEAGFTEPEIALAGAQSTTHKYVDAPDANVPPPALGTANTASFNAGFDPQETFEDATGWGTSKDVAPAAVTAASFTGATPYEEYDTWADLMVW